MKKSSTTTPPTRPRRSPCPVACALDVIGDRWTLILIRDLALGRTRFKEFASSPEGIPTNILSDRLERLTQQNIIHQVPAKTGSKHQAYLLTEKGKALFPILRAVKDWGLQWEPGTEARMAAVL